MTYRIHTLHRKNKIVMKVETEKDFLFRMMLMEGNYSIEHNTNVTEYGLCIEFDHHYYKGKCVTCPQKFEESI